MTLQINTQVYITQEKLKHMSNQTLVQHCSKQESSDKTNVRVYEYITVNVHTI